MFRQLVLVGLGNPGRRYDWTRHNLGFLVADAIVAKHAGRFSSPSRALDWADIRIGDTPVTVVKPQRYMNRSGGPLIYLRQQMEFELAELLVVADDIALPFGRLRLRHRGSDGGHNGLRSIAETLGSRDFARLRIGVGAPADGEDAADYVLERFGADERPGAEEMVDRAMACVEAVLLDGIDLAMGRFNAPVQGESD